MRLKPPNFQIAKVFDAIASDYDEVSYPYAVKRRNEILVRWAQGRCLEVGAAAGVLSRLLIAKGLRVSATDISPRMVVELKKKKIRAKVADCEKLPFPARSFDTVVASEVIYYLDHPERFIQEAYRVLKPGGQLLLSSANATVSFYDKIRTLLRRIGFSSLYFDDPVHEFMTESQLRTLLNKKHFSDITAQKIIVIPFVSLDWLNRIFERTIIAHFGMFIMIRSYK